MEIDVETMDKTTRTDDERATECPGETKQSTNMNILMTLLGIELRLLLLPRRLALIELVPFDVEPSRSRSNAFCVDASNDAYKLSAKSGK